MTIKLTIGKLRGLQQCASEKGTFTCLALDHRQNLRKANPAFIDDAELSRFKLDVTAALARYSTSVLLDPEVSAAQAIANGVIPKQTGLVVAVESTGYGGDSNARQSMLLPGWSVEKARRMGASMIKLLVYYHPGSPTAHSIEAFVQQVANECIRQDLGLMLEPLSYSLDPSKRLSSAEKRVVVTETARRLVIPGVDVLKAEFPADVVAGHPDESNWENACNEISLLSPVPWIVLSAAVDYEIYLHQVEVACRAGASGCAVGRAVWQEAVNMTGQARQEFLLSTGRQRLTRLSILCSDLGKPFGNFYNSEAPFNWYKDY